MQGGAESVSYIAPLAITLHMTSLPGPLAQFDCLNLSVIQGLSLLCALTVLVWEMGPSEAMHGVLKHAGLLQTTMVDDRVAATVLDGVPEQTWPSHFGPPL